MLGRMSAPDLPRPAEPVPGPLRSAPLWRKLAMAVASGLPPLGLLVAIPFVNRPAPIVLGLPFFQFWTTTCVALTGVCLTLVFHLDPRNSPKNGDGDEKLC
ncbi:hypothetical protein HMPREF9336_02154 [Segniliparus rugosus ATCC BAA-974]|uniref:DUF3311 domain-containing protein n=2 Tax=Segniliparus rugosus TaxID=286804 RepID=E5XRN2_SEGRC|nr:hypothetical protein HMPREF9336_02154 [Segniliparus rugosus ATCC BAA-974]